MDAGYNLNNVVELFYQASSKYGDSPAIITKNDSVTFKELEVKVKQTVMYLRKKGITKGDKVLIFVPISIDLYRILLALLHLGAVAVFVDEWAQPERLAYACSITNPKAIIGGWKVRVLKLWNKELRKIPMFLNSRGIVSDVTECAEVMRCAADDSALVTLTTGGTEQPKAANRTHGFLTTQLQIVSEELAFKPTDSCLTNLPMFVFPNLVSGVATLLPDMDHANLEKLSPEELKNAVPSETFSVVIGSPYFVEQLSVAVYNTKLPLGKVFVGGGPVFPSLAKKFMQSFPQTDLEIVYGSTEVEPISRISGRELVTESENHLEGLCVGQVHELLTAKVIQIIDEDLYEYNQQQAESLILKSNQIGEIIVSGKHVLASYINSIETLKKTKLKIDGELYHRTGDAGYIGEDSKLYLLGRCTDLIQTEHGYSSPFLVKEKVTRGSDILDGTLIKISGKIILVVVLNPKVKQEVNPDELSKLDIPFDEVCLLSHIPKDPRHNSKVDYDALRILILKKYKRN